MAEIVINIPTEHVTRVIDGLCGQFGYQETIPNPEQLDGTIFNPEGKQAFAKRMVIKGIRDAVRSFEAKTAAEAARLAAIESAAGIELS